ncbi:MAG: imidazoleglycerol-phosphate dehydratase HisB [Acidaminococcaceae bacterium]|nr:imidazoleglycerol-phosphate dehydratase HisB [Acidaminococcaceae bacterium]
MRQAVVERKTAETKIFLKLNLDGGGKYKVASGCGFMDHMLTLFAVHGNFDLELSCEGDTWVDYHHSVEDMGIALGQAFRQALGDKRGIRRYGNMLLPMDETLIMAATDFSGRSFLGYSVQIPTEKVGDFDTELVEEFWLGFVRQAECALHIRQLAGKNSHHIIEGIFKAVASSLRQGVGIDESLKDRIPSSKGVL